MNRQAGGLKVSLLLMMVILACAGWMFLEKQAVIDQMTVWQYKPSSDVSNLADNVAMSNKGRFLYYAAQPSLEESESFNKDCQRQEKGNAILGCFTMGRIFIYNIKDARLNGVKEVTAAHEMLHVAYERLNELDKKKINQLLEEEYSKQNNQELNNRMSYYARTQPGQRSNELHSIIGTEFSQISPELEEYYRKYFDDRTRVVNYFNSYSSKFESLRNESEQLLKNLNALVDEINQESKQYNDDLAVLNNDIEEFNRRASLGVFTSRAQFTSERSVLIERGDVMIQRRIDIEQKIKQHDTMQAKYNSLVDESNSLNRSLDSTLSAPPTPGIGSLES